MPAYTNTLELNHKPKSIPYGGNGEVREDGEANYGFKYIKGNESLLLQIPELIRDAALFELVRSINAPETGLFSVGCVSSPIRDQNGYRYTGYVEFAFNSSSSISDAQNYFPVWFHFDRCLHESKFQRAFAFSWELQPCVFTEANAPGFTCSVILNSHYSPSEDIALSAWRESLAFLGSYLQSVPESQRDHIYPQPT